MTDSGEKNNLISNDTAAAGGGNIEEGQRSIESSTPHAVESLQVRNAIFATACVMGVLCDPLFLYIPIINEKNKCLEVDKTLMIVALALRSFTDLNILIHIIYQIWEESSGKSKRAYAKAIIAGRIDSLSLFIIIVYFLAILPIPQLAILVGFFRMRDSGILNFLLLFQYAPNVYRLNLSSKKLPMKGVKWAKGSFNIVLYVLASHVFGAFWYFFSLQREILCWHQACSKTAGCKTTHHCNDNTSKDITFLNELCPINPSNATLFDFGIFLDALRAGNTGPVNFPRKFIYSFWWGIRNLSNFGTNLQTSSYVWENCFAILILFIGLLLFLYLIGNVQALMQWGTAKSVAVEEHKLQEKMKKKWEKIRNYLTSKSGLPQNIQKEIIERIQKKSLERNIEADVDMEFLFSVLPWHTEISIKELLKKIEMDEGDISMYLRSKDGLPRDMRTKIMDSINKELLGKNMHLHVDMKFLFTLLPSDIQKSIQRQLGMDALNKVPMLQHMDAEVKEMICYHLSPVIYEGLYNCNISKKGKEIDSMIFITEGKIWTDESELNVTEFLGEGTNILGEQLLRWVSPSISFINLPKPISTHDVRCPNYSKVEAFALKAEDLKSVVSKYRVKWNWGLYFCETNSKDLAELDDLARTHGTHQMTDIQLRDLWLKHLHSIQKRKTMKEILEWVSKNALPKYFKTEISESVIKIVNKNKNTDVTCGFVFFSLPLGIKRAIQEYVGLKALRKVHVLQNMPESTLVYLCRYLKPVRFDEGSYVIEAGQVLSGMVVIVDGVIKLTTNNTTSQVNAAATTAGSSTIFTKSCFQKGDIFGEELLSLASPSNSHPPPISNQQFKCQTKVEAFVLMNSDLTAVTCGLKEEWTYFFNSQHPLPHADTNLEKLQKLETTKLEEIDDESRQKMRMIMKKEKEIVEWLLSRNGLREDVKKEIITRIKNLKLLERIENIEADVDVKYLFSIALPWYILDYISYTLSINALNKVPMLEYVDDSVVDFLCRRVKPVIYDAGSCIVQAEEEHTLMLIIIEGRILLTDGTSGDTDVGSSMALGKGDLVGEQLLSWLSPNISLSERRTTPTSTRDVRCQTKVEAFAITAKEITDVISQFGLWGPDFNTDNNSQHPQTFGGRSVKRAGSARFGPLKLTPPCFHPVVIEE